MPLQSSLYSSFYYEKGILLTGQCMFTLGSRGWVGLPLVGTRGLTLAALPQETSECRMLLLSRQTIYLSAPKETRH